MILRDCIQRVQSLYSKGVHSQDTRLTSRHIYNKLSTVRNLLLSQKIRKKQKLNDQSYQTLNCVKVIKASKHSCPCIDGVDCNIYRTELQIPNFLMGFDKPLIQSVTSIDGEIVFDRTTWQRLKDVFFNRYTGTKHVYYVKDGYIYITNHKRIKAIAIRAVFEDNLAAHIFNGVCQNQMPCCDDCDQPVTCPNNLNYEFNVDNDLLEPIFNMTTSELVTIFFNIKADERNDARDDRVNTPND
jgi:hypothetical protein